MVFAQKVTTKSFVFGSYENLVIKLFCFSFHIINIVCLSYFIRHCSQIALFLYFDIQQFLYL